MTRQLAVVKVLLALRVMYVKTAVQLQILKNDERYQLDATTVIYYHTLSLHVSGIYTPIFRCTGCMLLHMVFNIRCSDCNTLLPVCEGLHPSRIITFTQCTRLRAGNSVLQSLHLMLNTICSNIQPVLLKMGI